MMLVGILNAVKESLTRDYCSEVLEEMRISRQTGLDRRVRKALIHNPDMLGLMHDEISYDRLARIMTQGYRMDECVAEQMEASDIADYVDTEAVAEYIDSSEIISHLCIDEEIVARHISPRDVAEYLDRDEVSFNAANVNVEKIVLESEVVSQYIVSLVTEIAENFDLGIRSDISSALMKAASNLREGPEV